MSPLNLFKQLLPLFTILMICINGQQSQSSSESTSLDNERIFGLDKDFTMCRMVATETVTVVACQTMTYIFSSADIAGRRVIIDSAVSFPRRTMENGIIGVTYVLNGNQVQRARLSSDGIILTQQLFTIPIDTSDIFSPQIQEVIVATNFTIIRFDNSTLQTYLRPRVLGNSLIRSRAGSLTLSSFDQVVYHFTQGPNSTSLTLFTNSGSGSLQSYLISFLSNDVGVTIRLVSNMPLQSAGNFVISSILQTGTGHLVIGCLQCNQFRGRVEIYNQTSFGLIDAFNGEADNQLLGTELTELSTSDNNSIVHIGSNSGGTINQRQFYSNILRIVTQNRNQTFIEFTKQAIKDVVGTPQGGLQLQALNNGQILFKYSFHRGLYQATLCTNMISFYSTTNRACIPCGSRSFALSLQQDSCTSCQNFTPSNDFQRAIFNRTCRFVATQNQTQNITNASSSSNQTTTSSVNQTTNQTLNQTQPPRSNSTSIPSQNQTSANTTSNQTTSQPNMTTSQSNQTASQTNMTSQQNQTSSMINLTTTNATSNQSSMNLTTSNQTAQVTPPTTTITSNQTQNSTASNSSSIRNTTVNVTPVNVTQNTTTTTPSPNRTANQSANISTNVSAAASNVSTGGQNASKDVAFIKNETISPNVSSMFLESSKNVTPSSQQSPQVSQKAIGIAIGISLLVACIIGGVLIWFCSRKRNQKAQKFKEMTSQQDQKREVSSNNYETTNIGHTAEDLRPRVDTMIEIHHVKSQSTVPLFESVGRKSQLQDMQKDNQVIVQDDPTPVDGLSFSEPVPDMKGFDSEQIQKELDREVQHLRNLFFNNAPSPIVDQESPIIDDEYDIESKPLENQSLRISQNQKVAQEQSITRFSTNKDLHSPSNPFDVPSMVPQQQRQQFQKKKKYGRGLFEDLEQSVAGLQIPSQSLSKKLSRTDKKILDSSIKENMTPNSRMNHQDASQIGTERTEIPESGRSLVQKKEGKSKQNIE